MKNSPPLFNLDSFRVPSDVNECFYIPNFINTDEEEYLLRKINETSKVNWRTLPERRLQVWGGEIMSNTLIPRALPSFITNHPPLISKLRNTGAFSNSKHGEPNHIIINQYHPGQGIMPHEDGPSYYPVVATISLGSHAVFHYHKYLFSHSQSEEPELDPESESHSGKSIDPNPILSLLLEPRSLIITSKNLYTEHLHSIQNVEYDVFQASSSTSTSTSESHSLSLTPNPTPGPPKLESINLNGCKIANWEMLDDEEMRNVVKVGGVLKRGTRVSLTCRDVERVFGSVNGSGRGKILKGLVVL